MNKENSILRRAMNALQKDFVLTDDEARKMVILVASAYGVLDKFHSDGNQEVITISPPYTPDS